MPLGESFGETSGQLDIMAIDRICDFCGNLRKDVSILNIGTANEKTAWELTKRGFIYVDALHYCEENIKVLRQNSLYNNYFICDYSCREFPILDGVYDVVLFNEIFGDHRLTSSTVRQIARVTKHGGVVVLGVGQEVSKKENTMTTESTMMELQTDNILECLSRHVIACSNSKMEVLYTFKKL
ncbi:hypothetical protein Btru_060327 [Bulinus truncatus]|nr:hypothetical protein Btru_060327 [Bulinus truncatus]